MLLLIKFRTTSSLTEMTNRGSFQRYIKAKLKILRSDSFAALAPRAWATTTLSGLLHGCCGYSNVCVYSTS